MSELEWDDTLLVGVPKFDNHHRRMMELVNEYVKALKANKSNAALAPMVMSLYEYTKMHFNSEEDFLRQVGFPEIEPHIEEHDLLLKEVLDYHEKIKNNQDVDSLAVLSYLKRWLIKHINDTDKAYTTYYQEQTTA